MKLYLRDIDLGNDLTIGSEFDKMNEALNAAFKSHTAKVSEILEKSVRENSIPPIKGELTKGKLRWRGIKRIVQNDFLRTREWIEQRGKRISPIIECEYSTPIK